MVTDNTVSVNTSTKKGRGKVFFVSRAIVRVTKHTESPEGFPRRKRRKEKEEEVEDVQSGESFNSDTPRKRGIAPHAMEGRQLPSDLPREAS